MSRKTTAALIAALGINFAMAGGAIMLANLNKPAVFDVESEFGIAPGDLKEVAGIAVNAEAGEVAVPIMAAQQGGNTRVTFTCAKITPAGRDVHEGTWDQIAGAVLYQPDEQRLIAIEADFDTRSLRTDAPGLTNTVTAKEKWFDIDNHPVAQFVSKSVESRDAATSSYTHEIVGTFTLNGISKEISFPAKLAYAGQSLTLDASLTILRSDFNVKKRESSLAGSVGSVASTVEDEVQLAIRVIASPDPTAVISELARVVEDQQEQLRIAGVERERLMGLARRVELLEEATDRLATSGVGAVDTVDTAGLPATYTDYAEGDDRPVPFGMFLVPGDSAKGVEPFYMATHEVSWEMIKRWMYSNDLEQAGVSANEISKLVKAGLRPSPLYEDPAQFLNVPDEDRPALAMSLLTATSYCKWLSEKTGRRYRLATIDEWKHAAKLGGGLPVDLDAAAWHAGNLDEDLYSKRLSGRVGTKQPNGLGIYDMFGNACEWVTGTGINRVVVGGHYLLPPEEFTFDWQEVEDLDIWCANSTQVPPGRFWFNAFHYTGIRLVCEPASVAANPPKAGD
jgi:polyisoprenoid-binding protein YceI